MAAPRALFRAFSLLAPLLPPGPVAASAEEATCPLPSDSDLAPDATAGSLLALRTEVKAAARGGTNLLRDPDFSPNLIAAWTSYCPPKHFRGHRDVAGACLPATATSLLNGKGGHAVKASCRKESRGGIFQTFVVRNGSAYDVIFDAASDPNFTSSNSSIHVGVQSPLDSFVIEKVVLLKGIDAAGSSGTMRVGPFRFIARDSMARIFLYAGSDACPFVDNVTVQEASDQSNNGIEMVATGEHQFQDADNITELRKMIKDRDEYIHMLEQQHTQRSREYAQIQKGITSRDARIEEYRESLRAANESLQQYASEEKARLDVIYSNGTCGTQPTDQESFNKAVFGATRGGSVIVRRVCDDCNLTYKDIYYRRFWGTWDPWNELMVNFKHKRHHKRFNLYSTLEDAIQDANAWKYCAGPNASDHVGFPATCAPSFKDAADGQWNSASDAGVRNFEFSVYWTPPAVAAG